MDHVGILARKDVTKDAWGKTVDGDDDLMTTDTSYTSDSDSDDTEDEQVDEEAAQNANENAGADLHVERAEQPTLAQRALTRRLTCRNRHRMQQIDMSNKRMYEGCSFQHN